MSSAQHIVDARRLELELREQIAMRNRRILALEKQCALLAAEVDRLHAAEVGLNLFRQLVRGSNALRDLDVFACNPGEHEPGCECFWEQCEQWAAAEK